MINLCIVNDKRLDKTYKTNLKRYIKFIILYYLDKDLCNLSKYERKKHQLITLDRIKDFYKIIIPTVKISSKNICKHNMALQKLVNFESTYFNNGNVSLHSKRLVLLDKSTELGQIIDNNYKKQKNNIEGSNQRLVKDNIDSIDHIHMTVIRKDLEKV